MSFAMPAEPPAVPRSPASVCTQSLEDREAAQPVKNGRTTPVLWGRGKLTLNTAPRERGGVQRLAEQDGRHRARAPGGGTPIGGMVDYLAARVGTPGGPDPDAMVFAGASQRRYTVSKDSFSEIPDSAEPRKIAFVDGGNALLAEAPAFLIGMNRVYYSMFRGSERQRPSMRPRMEFFSCLTAGTVAGRVAAPAALRHPPDSRAAGTPQPDRSLYSVKLFAHAPGDRGRLPPDDDLGITEEDVRRRGASRAGLLGVPRKMAEWAVADSVVDGELAAGDVLVMDGTLQSGSGRESGLAARVYKRAVRKGVVVCGLAKTTTLTTVDNRPLIHRACEVAGAAGLGDRRWFVRIGERATANDMGYTLVVRLHEKSAYAFRFGILAEQYWTMGEDEVESVLASVAANSRDIAMPGYPYGAIDADRFAKVRMREASMYRNMLDAVLAGRPDGADIAAQIRSMSAHQVLNRVTG